MQKITNVEVEEVRNIGADVQAMRHNGVHSSERIRVLSITDVLKARSRQWRVDGLLPMGGMSMVYAPQGEFKTFFALDLALSVAHGLPFQGRRVKQGPTVYVLAEGTAGLKDRIRAWLKEYGVTEEHGKAFFVLEAVQFKRPADAQLLAERIEALGIEPAMLFIDTFARHAVGVDENHARDVGEWIDGVAALQRRLNADVVALHHAQKGSNDGGRVRERGSSAFIAAVDTAIRLSKKKGKVVVTCEKQKDAAEFTAFGLTVKAVSLGQNEHGEESGSCVLVTTDLQDDDLASEMPHLNETQMVVMSVLKVNGPLTVKDWRTTSMKVLKRDVCSATFRHWKDKLVQCGLVEQTSRKGTYRATTTSESAMPPANGASFIDGFDPTCASHATPLIGVADGAGEAGVVVADQRAQIEGIWNQEPVIEEV
jgi:hypothetical protein